MAPRTPSFEYVDTVWAGNPAAALDAGDPFGCDTLRGDDVESGRAAPVDVDIDIGMEFRVDIDISQFD